MASYVISIAVDDVISALIAFLQPFAPTLDIVRGQDNRVNPPTGPFLEVTEALSVDLETPTVSNDKTTQVTAILGPKRFDMQVDFYGPASGDQCNAVKTTWRTGLAVGLFPANIKPLYCSDGIQAPLITGEQQYESRWTLTASLQYNPIVSIPQQSATALALNILEDLQ